MNKIISLNPASKTTQLQNDWGITGPSQPFLAAFIQTKFVKNGWIAKVTAQNIYGPRHDGVKLRWPRGL